MEGPLSSFLGKFLRLYSTQEAMKKVFIESVQITSGILLTEEVISIKDDVVIVNGSPSLKNKLLMDGEKILEYFNARAPRRVLSIR